MPWTTFPLPFEKGEIHALIGENGSGKIHTYFLISSRYLSEGFR